LRQLLVAVSSLSSYSKDLAVKLELRILEDQPVIPVPETVVLSTDRKRRRGDAFEWAKDEFYVVVAVNDDGRMVAVNKDLR
jgi:hypothetical protein